MEVVDRPPVTSKEILDAKPPKSWQIHAVTRGQFCPGKVGQTYKEVFNKNNIERDLFLARLFRNSHSIVRVGLTRDTATTLAAKAVEVLAMKTLGCPQMCGTELMIGWVVSPEE